MSHPRKTADVASENASTRTPHGTVAGVRGETCGDGTETQAAKPVQAQSQATQSLIDRARAGDRSAFERLLREARPRALAVATKVLRNPDDAEDAVQEGFLKAWRNLGRFEGRSSFTTWIHRIVMNASLDLLRRHACRPGVSAAGEQEAESFERHEAIEMSPETPERAYARRQASNMVQGALAVLSPSHREAITLRELEEHSYEEIAQIAACPIGTVMSRLHHARRKIADELRATLPVEDLALAA
jgi:RNA polymerase sigma-70 factor (ECF subfamily)